jgi:sugar O-acyltransferase (sialic acid O-acetyltransferase NeuD family)
VTTNLVIIGAGGHGRETLDIVEACNAVNATYEFLGFCADEYDPALIERRKVDVIGELDVLANTDAGYVIGIGTSETRRDIDAQVSEFGREAVVLAHPSSSLGSDLRFAPGVILAAGARVTTNVTLGRHTHLNVNAVVSHDCEIGDYVTLSPGVLVNGAVTLGEGVFLGTGAIVLPGRTVGAWARIGAGAVVTEDVAPGQTVVGVPARAVDR